MGSKKPNAVHAAEGSALGFWYQAFYALLTLVAMNTDDAAIGIEQLDDIELNADGQTLLFQLKHSISPNPPPITIKSRSLWRTIKVWIDALEDISLAETTFHLVAVGPIGDDCPLQALTDVDADRAALAVAMTAEALRVVDARAAAAKAKTPIPYGDRIDGCKAFLGLTEGERISLLRRMTIKPSSPTIVDIEPELAGHFDLVLPEHRNAVARRLIEWWDRQVVYALCGQRHRLISRGELQSQIMSAVADLEQEKLVPEFETLGPPTDYQPDSMLSRQIALVKGKAHDYARAIREEWKAREQRGRWIANNPAMRSKINDYDHVLQEHWSDKHIAMKEECSESEDDKKCSSGLDLLRWTHDHAPTVVRPIAEGWGAAYYVRGSYQVLAINLKVGWHPDFKSLLEGGE